MRFKRKNKLANKLLFIDGLSGSGKSLISPILTSLNKCELYLYDHLFEEVLVLLENKKIEFNAAKILLQTHADMNLYNIMIGRNVNFRGSDHSSVDYTMNRKKFLKRLKLKDGEHVIAQINREKKWLPIITHYALPYFLNLQKIFNNRKCLFVSIAREPIHLINSFYKDNWEKKIVSNQKDLTLTYIDSLSKYYPWYFKDTSKKATFIEKYAEYVLKYFDFQKKFSSRNHHIIYYENFIKNPTKEIIKLNKKLGNTTNITRKLINSFKLPRSMEKNYSKNLLSKNINNNIKLKKKILKISNNYLKNIV